MTHDDGVTRTELVVPEARQPQTLLAPYGSRREIMEYADRLMASVPVRLQGGQVRAMTLPEAKKLAEAALAHRLDPHLGQIYLLVDNKGIPSLHVGPSGYELHASRQMKQEGGGSWHSEYVAVTEAQERNELMVPPKGIAYHCRLYDTRTTLAYVEGIKAATAAGATWPEIIAVFGQKPFTPGFGLYVPIGGRPDDMYPPHSRAKKRALHDALKKRFALEFPGISDGDLPEEFTGPYSARMNRAGEAPVQAEPSRPAGQEGAPGGATEAPIDTTARDPDQSQAPESPPPPPDEFEDPAAMAARIEAEQKAKRAKSQKDKKDLYGDDD